MTQHLVHVQKKVIVILMLENKNGGMLWIVSGTFNTGRHNSHQHNVLSFTVVQFCTDINIYYHTEIVVFTLSSKVHR